MLSYLYWPVAVALMAAGQGLLLPTFRACVPPTGAEARRVSFALHVVLTSAYLLPLLLAPGTWLAALGSRLLFFDLILNATSGKPIFYVGSTALADRALQALARRTGWDAQVLRFAGWLLALGLAVCWIIFK